MVEELEKKGKEEEDKRDEEVDIAKAVDTARNWIKKYVGGSLNLLQFRIEQVKQNGSKTKYNVIVSLVPDVGEERCYYLIKVNVLDGKIVPPLGKGKLEDDGGISFKEIKLSQEFEK